MLLPAYAVYNYYEHDDGVWLHVDADECEVTLLAAVLGEVGPLHVHPELRGTDLETCEVLERSPGWDDASGVRVPYPRLGVLAMRGRLLPHHRPPTPMTTVGAVAALHYRSVL
jgi:hypothetical protein